MELNDDQDGEWVSVSSGTGSPGYSRTRGHKTVVVVVVVEDNTLLYTFTWLHSTQMLSLDFHCFT